MFRRKTALLLSLLLALPCLSAAAEAAQPWEPVPINPQDRYETYGMEDEDLIWWHTYCRVDEFNDEIMTARESGPVVMRIQEISGGQAAVEYSRAFAIAEGIPYVIEQVPLGSDSTYYSTYQKTYLAIDGELAMATQIYTADEMDGFWASGVFPISPPDTILGFQQEYGYTYLLVYTAGGLLLEYVAGQDYQLLETRFYAMDDAGDWVLEGRVICEQPDSLEIPESVRAAAAADMGK